MVRILICK